MKTLCKAIVSGALLLQMTAANALEGFVETPSLAAQVQSGELPPVEARLPAQPQLVQLGAHKTAGMHGGELRLLMGKQKDIRQIIIYGYARLVGYTPELELQTDILESYEVFENRIFTLHLRKGHKWSDGHPFTSEDFRYYWEDMALRERHKAV